MIPDCLLTCPQCGHQQTEHMPENTCQQFYTCNHCKAKIAAKADECCVYCSYGDIPCPLVQVSGGACCGDWTS